jgi:hypothetical protein
MPLERLVALGGGSASGVWCQLMADILRRPLLVAQEAESTCLGSGMLAAAAAGIHPSIPDAARAMSSTGAEYVPDDARAKTYDAPGGSCAAAVSHLVTAGSGLSITLLHADIPAIGAIPTRARAGGPEAHGPFGRPVVFASAGPL